MTCRVEETASIPIEEVAERIGYVLDGRQPTVERLKSCSSEAKSVESLGGSYSFSYPVVQR